MHSAYWKYREYKRSKAHLDRVTEWEEKFSQQLISLREEFQRVLMIFLSQKLCLQLCLAMLSLLVSFYTLQCIADKIFLWHWLKMLLKEKNDQWSSLLRLFFIPSFLWFSIVFFSFIFCARFVSFILISRILILSFLKKKGLPLWN